MGLGGDYLAHALLEVRGEAAGGDGASAVHAVDEVGGHGGEHLAKYIDHPLVPSATADGAAALLGPRVVAGGPGAELLLLGVDAAVEAQARDAVALGGHVHHRGLEKLLEAGQRELRHRNPSVRSREEEEEGEGWGGVTWERGLTGASVEDDMASSGPRSGEKTRSAEAEAMARPLRVDAAGEGGCVEWSSARRRRRREEDGGVELMPAEGRRGGRGEEARAAAIQGRRCRGRRRRGRPASVRPRKLPLYHLKKGFCHNTVLPFYI